MRGLVERLKNRLSNGIEQVIKPGSSSFADVLTAVKSAGGTVVYLALSASDAGNLAKALREDNVAARFYGPDLLLNEVYRQRAGDAGEGTRVTFAIDPLSSPTVSACARSCRCGRRRRCHPALSIAAVEVFAAAAKGSDVNNGRAMADWMKGGSPSPTIHRRRAV